MAIIRFGSSSVLNTMKSGVEGSIMSSTASTQQSLIAGNTTTGISQLLIYKGDVPSFPAFEDYGTRSTDLLITFSLPANSYDEFGIIDNTAKYLIAKHPAAQMASGTGVATWFLLCRTGTTSLLNKGAMIGTVGLPNSGADLEIVDTNIVSGNGYQCAGILLNFPQNWVL